jgi:hypothetical protein
VCQTTWPKQLLHLYEKAAHRRTRSPRQCFADSRYAEAYGNRERTQELMKALAHFQLSFALDRPQHWRMLGRTGARLRLPQEPARTEGSCNGYEYFDGLAVVVKRKSPGRAHLSRTRAISSMRLRFCFPHPKFRLRKSCFGEIHRPSLFTWASCNAHSSRNGQLAPRSYNLWTPTSAVFQLAAARTPVSCYSHSTKVAFTPLTPESIFRLSSSGGGLFGRP